MISLKNVFCIKFWMSSSHAEKLKTNKANFWGSEFRCPLGSNFLIIDHITNRTIVLYTIFCFLECLNKLR